MTFQAVPAASAASDQASSQTGALTQLSSCDLCGNPDLSSVLDLGHHPLCDDLVPIGNERVCRRYPIEVLYCPVCRTAHQRHQVPKTDLFPPSYHYRARFTRDVLSGMADLVSRCERHLGPLAGKRVLDVGCNDGSLLELFARRGAVGTGVEPTDAGLEARARGHRVYGDFLTPDLAHRIAGEQGQPDLLVFTNVFAHIQDMQGLLASVRRLMGATTVLVVENHYLGSVIARGQFDTFYHEHPRTYSVGSFGHVARALGRELSLVEFPKRYGGNIRVFIEAVRHGAAPAASPASMQAPDESDFEQGLRMLSRRIARWRQRKADQLAALVDAHGPLRAKAFPGRAAILIGLLGVDHETIATVHEKPGSMKIGCYVPATRIPIESDDALFANGDQRSPLVNLAWHIGPEIRCYLAEHGWRGPVVDIFD